MTDIPSDTDIDIQRYIKCMEEINRRTHVVNSILTKKINTGFAITNAELLAVQFRKIAELIALSSICPHKAQYQALRKEFHRDWNYKPILEAVERINPKHYPSPIKPVAPSPGNVFPAQPILSGYLTKDKLVEMGNTCANILHAFNPYQTTLPSLDDFFGKANSWISEIHTLLEHHRIQLIDSKKQWWVQMHAKSDGKVHVSEMEVAD